MKDGLDGTWKIVDTISKLLLAVVLGILGYIYSRIDEHSRAIAVIDATQFTASDGYEMMQSLLVPPIWLREDLDAIREELQQLRAQIRVIEAKIK